VSSPANDMMPRKRPLVAIFHLQGLAALALAGALGAQPAPHALRPLPLVELGGVPAGEGASLLRAATEALPGAGDGFRAWLVGPELEGVWNSDIPHSLNHGSIWAGRGLSTRLRAGVHAAWGPLRVTLAPERVHQANREFEHFHYQGHDRSAFSSPWHLPHTPMDLPLRHGDRPLTRWWPGQSRAAVVAGPLSGGFSTENRWWGPGVRNALVLSDNAPGFPHAFLDTERPLALRWGTLEGVWLLGTLTESLFYDADPRNDHRSINGGALSFTPAAEPGITLGLARAVQAAISAPGETAGHALDLFRLTPRHSAPAGEEDGEGGDGTAAPADPRAQITTLFARWEFPADHLAVYGEWGRHERPGSLRDLLLAPNHTQGYTVGARWAGLEVGGARLRLSTEVTYLEKSPTFRNRPMVSWYKSELVPHGYTHHGQVIGAAIGPGASSQWIAADLLGGGWSLGVDAGRIRWENDIFYETRYNLLPRNWHQHDVTVFAGARGEASVRGVRLSADYTLGQRLNFLFQNPGTGWGTPEGTVDVRNHTLRVLLSVTPP
jgi:hypothetical protein